MQKISKVSTSLTPPLEISFYAREVAITDVIVLNQLNSKPSKDSQPLRIAKSFLLCSLFCRSGLLSSTILNNSSKTNMKFSLLAIAAVAGTAAAGPAGSTLSVRGKMMIRVLSAFFSLLLLDYLTGDSSLSFVIDFSQGW